MPVDALELRKLYEKIDEIDNKINDLLSLRASHVLEIAKIRVKEEGEQANFYRPDREAQVIHQVIAYNKVPLGSHSVANIFRTIMVECRNLQTHRYRETKS